MGFCIFCIVLGLLISILGLRFKRRNKTTRNTCTERTTGTVIKNEEVCLKDESGKDVWAFSPRFSYTAHNVPMEASADWGTVSPRFREGQHVTLYYDPKDPTHISVDDNRRTSNSMTVSIVFGFLFAAVGAVLLIISF